MEEDTYLFSAQNKTNEKPSGVLFHPGIDFDLHDARGLEKHWLLAVENSQVVWVNDKDVEEKGTTASVLLKSEAFSNIFYLYENLYRRNLEVREKQILVRGEPVGTAWGSNGWGHLHFSVIWSDSVPQYNNRYSNVVNFFPQIYEMYSGQPFNFSKSFSKGRIFFNQPTPLNGNETNLSAFEDFLGKGWLFASCSPTGKVEGLKSSGRTGARLTKTLFKGTAAEYSNPGDYYTYEINVPNGVYRIRARVGDARLASWQKVAFEGIAAGAISAGAGELVWTGEKVVRVNDSRLTIEIYTDPENLKPSGISEIVFQRAN